MVMDRPPEMSVPSSHHSVASASTDDAAARDDPPAPIVYWTAADTLDHAAIRRLTAELSEEEAGRAGAFHFDRDRATYIAAHAMLRRVLRQAHGVEEPDIVLSPLGRPELMPQRDGRPAPSFNLTHTRDFAACAILHGAPIGIDAEDIRRPIDVAEMAGRWFHPSERRLLKRIAEVKRVEMFFRVWTLKEAILKTTGHGLRIEPQLFAVDPDRGRAVVPRELGIPTRWRLAELSPLPDIRLALAVPGKGMLAPTVARIEL
jgi:4'-phosphopantetheinyl transferase